MVYNKLSHGERLMKISDIQTDAKMQQDGEPTKVDKAQISTEVKNPLSDEEKVEISAESKQMKKIRDVLDVTPDVRTKRVDALKKLVESGEYDVESNALADKMIKDFLWEMNQ